MNTENLDSCIEALRSMLGDQFNEFGPEQRRALEGGIKKLKRLKKQPKASRKSIYLIVEEIAGAVSKSLTGVAEER